jgi:hypothetical protein
MHPTFSHPLLGPTLHNLLFIHLSEPWGKVRVRARARARVRG